MSTNRTLDSRIQIIINPSARSGRGQADLRRVLQREPDLRPTCVASESPQHFRALVRAAQDPRAGIAALGIAGGDGTVTLALQALRDVEQTVPLCVLPTGSGNDFVNDLCGSRGLKAALTLLRTGQPRWVDVGEARTPAGDVQPFCCVASVGLDAVALRVIHGSRWPRSKALNLYGALRGLWQYQPVTASIRWDGGAFVGPIAFCTVTNTRSYGGGFRVSPAARLDDGRLDLCIVPQQAKAALLWRFPRILTGTHGDIAGVVQAQTRRVHIAPADPRQPLPLCLDGDLPILGAPVELGLRPARLLVLAPAAATAAPQQNNAAKKEAA